MFEWFSLAFAEPKEQARLFMVLISTFLAITILLLNQWFITRRARKERLIEKLEELTTAVHGFCSESLEINRLLSLGHINNETNSNSLRQFNAQIDKLNALYFQELPVSTKLSNEITNELSDDIAVKKTSYTNSPLNPVHIRHTEKRLNDWFEVAKNTINTLTKKHIK